MKELYSAICNRIGTYKEVRKFLVIFFIIGFLGLSIEQTHLLFLKLTPYALLINIGLLAIYHSIPFDKKTITIFIAIYLISFLIEAIGVNTGKIFGNYIYGSGLGLKIYETPLLIGFNWLFLLYVSRSVIVGLQLNRYLTILFASFIMVGYDFILEQVAPFLDMWSWEYNEIPTQNYIAWFVISLCFHAMLEFFQIQTLNRLSKILLLFQFLFFIGLYIIIK